MRIKRIAQAIAFTFVSAAVGNFALAIVPCAGAAFVPLRPSDVNYVQHSSDGVWNTDSANYHFVIASLSTLLVTTSGASNRSILVKGRNYGQSLTCYAIFTRTSDGSTWAGLATTTTNGTFVLNPSVPIPAGNQNQELAVQVECGLPPTGSDATVIFSAS
jgi:hypothetical protein